MQENNSENRRENKAEGEKGIIAGRNAVMEALKSGRVIDTLYIQKGERSGSLTVLIKRAREKGVVIKETDGRKLDFLCSGAVHQGVVASAAIKEYASLQDVLELAKQRNEPPFLILCDELTDPHNLGAILRTAECAGVHGVIIPKHRSVSLSYAVGKASAGAVEYVPVVRVGNMVALIEELKTLGIWIYAADMGGQSYCDTDFSGGVALVIGSEGQGVGRLIREKSDFAVSLPMKGKIDSLNASVACGILCYEVARQREKSAAKQ